MDQVLIDQQTMKLLMLKDQLCDAWWLLSKILYLTLFIRWVIIHIDCLFSIADLQMVNISLRVLARPDQTFLPQIYRQIGTDYDERVLPSICNEVRQTEVLIDVWTIFPDQRFVCDLHMW